MPQAYANARDIEPLLAEQAVRIAERLGDRFFADQRLAARALPLLGTGSKLPAWLRNLDALIVDEVQDLTLLQTLVLGQLARTRLQRRPDAPLVVAVAGDESQIVQPSGFDWGESKDLMRDLLGANPIEFEFRHQRRSPHNLARLIDNAWSFYSYLPKPLRPSANRQTFLDDAGHELSEHTAAPEDENGRILICPLPADLQAAQSGAGLEPAGGAAGRAARPGARRPHRNAPITNDLGPDGDEARQRTAGQTATAAGQRAGSGQREHKRGPLPGARDQGPGTRHGACPRAGPPVPGGGAQQREPAQQPAAPRSTPPV